VDLDLITSSRTRSRLTTFLTKERDFILERRWDIDDRVLCRKINHKSIDIDFGTMEVEDRFEGRTESLSMEILNERTIEKEINSVKVEIPEISLLLIFKCKAAWDRNTRLKNNTSNDPVWERSKLIKDLSDIISLLDTDDVLDIGFLGRFFQEHDFLRSIFDLVIKTSDSIEKYGSDQGHVNGVVERFKSLIFQE
jgi:hypothetical protein